ncbi:MAG: PucR family transcriptional regulator [Solirubrobacteraceae bacterium]
MLTVRDLLDELGLHVLAGEGGLDLPVRWVHISELLDPTPWLSGGEVLLSTGMQLGDEDQAKDFAARLADHRLAGLGFGSGFGHDHVPEAILELAAARDFPVFEVPYELPFIAVTEAAFTQLVNEQYAVLRRALAAQERLERVLLTERGLDALAGTLATLIGAAVLVFDARGELIVQHAFRRPLTAETLEVLHRQVRERGQRRDARAFMPETADSTQALALPVSANGMPGGASASSMPVPEAWLMAIKDAGPLSDFDRLTLRQAVITVALERLRSRVAGDTERRLAGDVLAAVVAAELTGGELIRRLEPFGLSDQLAAIVLSRPAGGRGTGPTAEAAVWATLKDEAVCGLVASVETLTCALVPAAGEEELVALARRAAERAGAVLGETLPVGVGRSVAPQDARRSFHEARCALEALSFGAGGSGNGRGPGATGNGSAPPGEVPVATWRDLGSFQLLLSLQDDEALRLFCDSVLAPIEASEGHYGGELMRSLEAFIEENGQWERAARRLYCHRHTLRYRIRRVEELTGRSLSTARDRIDFWLALRGRELVK